MSKTRLSSKLALVATLIGVACSEPATSAVSSRAALSNASSGPVLVACPVDSTVQASAVITPLGGIVSAGGTSITVPAGAVLVPTTISVTVPASKYMEVDITANGAEHFTFQVPVTVSVGYSRCSRSNIDKSALSVWHIDTATKALLQNMGGTDDKTARTVTFSTDHLSGYAIAN
jgi:hypothetical protein